MSQAGGGPGFHYTQSGIGLGGAIAVGTDGVVEDAPQGQGFVITGIDIDTVGDDGGWGIVASGLFGLSPNVRVTIRDSVTGAEWKTYSGIQGNSDLCVSEDSATVRFVVPPISIGGPYDIEVESEDGTFSSVLADALTVIHRDFVTRLYSLRSHWPPPRNVGPYSIFDEDWDG